MKIVSDLALIKALSMKLFLVIGAIRSDHTEVYRKTDGEIFTTRVVKPHTCRAHTE